MGWSGVLPYQVMFKRTYQMIQQSMGKAYAVEFSELFAEYLRALHWLLPYPRDNQFMRTDHKQIWVWSNYRTKTSTKTSTKTRTKTKTRTRTMTITTTTTI